MLFAFAAFGCGEAVRGLEPIDAMPGTDAGLTDGSASGRDAREATEDASLLEDAVVEHDATTADVGTGAEEDAQAPHDLGATDDAESRADAATGEDAGASEDAEVSEDGSASSDAEILEDASTVADAGAEDAAGHADAEGFADAEVADRGEMDAGSFDAGETDALTSDARPAYDGGVHVDDAGRGVFLAATCLPSRPFVRVRAPLWPLCQPGRSCSGLAPNRRVWLRHTKSSTLSGWRVHMLFDTREYEIPYPGPEELQADATSLLSFGPLGSHHYLSLEAMSAGPAELEACVEGHGAAFARVWDGFGGPTRRVNVDAFTATSTAFGRNLSHFSYTSTAGVPRLLWELR